VARKKTAKHDGACPASKSLDGITGRSNPTIRNNDCISVRSGTSNDRLKGRKPKSCDPPGLTDRPACNTNPDKSGACIGEPIESIKICNISPHQIKMGRFTPKPGEGISNRTMMTMGNINTKRSSPSAMKRRKSLLQIPA
jgi:hypothetical protein